jgi:RNA polymerase sigma-70 factor (ECF subfamily)
MRNREFIRLLAEHERRLAGYVHILVPVWQDAEDVLQNTKLWLWEQFDSFQPGTDFAAWAIATANNMVRTYRKRHQRQRVSFSTDVIEKISQHIPAVAPTTLSDRASALMKCVNRLNDASQRLLRLVCMEHRKVKDIAVELGQTPTATSVALFRIRRTLFECVEERMREKEA